MPQGCGMTCIRPTARLVSLQSATTHDFRRHHRVELTAVIPAWSAAKRRAYAERMSPMRSSGNDTPVKIEEDQQPGSAMSGHSNQPGRSFWPPTPEGTVQPGRSYASGVAHANSNVVSSSQVQRGRRGSLPEYDQLPVRHTQQAASVQAADTRRSSSACTKSTSTPSRACYESSSHPRRRTWICRCLLRDWHVYLATQIRRCHYQTT